MVIFTKSTSIAVFFQKINLNGRSAHYTEFSESKQFSSNKKHIGLF